MTRTSSLKPAAGALVVLMASCGPCQPQSGPKRGPARVDPADPDAGDGDEDSPGGQAPAQAARTPAAEARKNPIKEGWTPRQAPRKPPKPAVPVDSAGLKDSFDAATVDAAVWTTLRQGDFKVARTDIVDVGTLDKPDRRLRLAANTLGTDDSTVKYLGVRTTKGFDFRRGGRFAVNIDWNDQKNSAYLTAALYLVPTSVDDDPAEARDWFRWEFIGVPQDNLVRGAVTSRSAGNRRWLERFGWPKIRRGRPVGNHRIEILIDSADVVILEQGREVFRKQNHGLKFTKAALALVISAHSNYYERTILFDDVVIEKAKVPPPPG